MRIRLLGGLSVEGFDEKDLGSRKARTLLKVLAVARGSPVSVDQLIDALWTDELPARPSDQVGILISRLRRTVGAGRIARSDAGFCLLADWLDLDELEARTIEAVEALGAGRLSGARASARAALDLAHGSLLPEEYGDWAAPARDAAAAHVATARRVAAEAAALAGDDFGAVAAAEEALVADPYDEVALRILMKAHSSAGRPASALGAYVRTKERLSEDLGVSPAAETESVHDAILLEEGRQRRPLAPRTSLPGRLGELAQLDNSLEAASQGATPTGVVVVGEPGIGKSTLLEHWLSGLEPQAVPLLGRCDPLGRDLPLQPLADAVVGRLEGLDQPERDRILGDDARIVGPLLGIDVASVPTVADHTFDQARLFSSLLAVIGRMGAGKPVALAIDDFHHAGRSTISWVRFALHRPTKLMIVGASRSGLGELGPLTRKIELGPIDREAAVAIVGPERADALHARSGGHPLLLVALGMSPPGTHLPETVIDAVAQRVSGLGPAAATVRVAAVLGSKIDLDLLSNVTRSAAVELLAHLESAVLAGVMVERGNGFAFRHDIERESLAASTGPARRALAHREAARWLSQRTAPDPLVVAIHARQGGDIDLAGAWFIRAAEVAVARSDAEAADAHLRSSLEMRVSADALTARARLRMATGNLEEAAVDASAAVGAGGGELALEVSGWIAYYRRRYEEALAFAGAALERADDASIRASCLSLAGRVHHGAGRLHEATSRLELAMVDGSDVGVRALASIWLAQAKSHQGQPEEALSLLERALVDPERIAHPFAPLHGWFTRALALGYTGRSADALAACDALDIEVIRRGELGARMAAPAGNVRAWLLRWTGDPDRADDLNRAAIESAEPTGHRAEAYFAGLLDLADGRLLADDDGSAADLLNRLAPLEEWGGTMAWHQRHRWGLLKARLALRDGDNDLCTELAQAVAADANSRGAQRYEFMARAVALTAGAKDDIAVVLAGLRRCAAMDGTRLIEGLETLR